MITTTSLNLAAFIACREALVTVAYQDGPNMSIGFGSNDPSLKPGDTITVEDAFTLLKSDIKAREPTVAKEITNTLSQEQFDAVFDLFYQYGSAGLKGIASIVNPFDPGLLLGKFEPMAQRVGLPLDPISKEFQKFAIPSNTTTVSPGLLIRRNDEIDLFWNANYGNLSTILVYAGNPATTKPTTMAFDYTSFGTYNPGTS